MKVNVKFGDNNYTIVVTNTSYDLIKHSQNTTEGSKNFGQPTESTIGYCTTMSSALNKLIRDTFADSDEVLTIKEYVARLEDAVESLKDYTTVGA